MNEDVIKATSTISYNGTFYTGAKLKLWAEAFCERMPKGVRILVSAGSSGCAIASAMLVIRPDLLHKHIHPEGMVSFRGTSKLTSGVSMGIKDKVVFVDDFIDTGITVRGAIGNFQKLHPSAKVVAILMGCKYSLSRLG